MSEERPQAVRPKLVRTALACFDTGPPNVHHLLDRTAEPRVLGRSVLRSLAGRAQAARLAPPWLRTSRGLTANGSTAKGLDEQSRSTAPTDSRLV